MLEVARLYVSPFDADRLPVILAPAFLADASDISFHSIATFPEKTFGYLTLPKDKSEQIRKKFHGCILKGQKMKVEEARAKRSTVAPQSNDIAQRVAGLAPPTSSTSRQHGEISAIELPKDRKVKRGWTGPAEKRTPKAKDKQKRSKAKEKSISGEDECLFRTSLPVTTKEKKEEESDKAKKRKRGAENAALVHEFRNTRKLASSPKDSETPTDFKPAHGYIDGTGWVDQRGNVIEKEQRRRTSHGISAIEGPQGLGQTKVSHTDATQPELETVRRRTRGKKGQSATKDATEGPTESHVDNGDEGVHTASVERLSISRSSGSPIPHTDTQPTSAPASGVHPLEALFKRPKVAASQSQTPKKPHLELETSFKLFPDESSVGESGLLLPQTPYTQQDFRHRRQRSAAPTPDTALPGKSFEEILRHRDEDGESDIEEEDGQVTGGAESQEASAEGGGDVGQQAQESTFAKEFWEKRREGNRDWKRRKREATKAKRLRDRKEKK